MGGIGEWIAVIQSLPLMAKWLVSLTVIFVGCVVVYVVWQRPAPAVSNPVSGPGHQTVLTSDVKNADHGVAATQSGHHNTQTTIGGEHNVNAPISDALKQQAPVSSVGQTGGQTAGFILNVPVTETQKQQALSALRAQLRELKNFPDLVEIKDIPDVFESSVMDRRPIQLYAIVNPYYEDTLRNAPEVGDRLYKFKADYYEFRATQLSLERDIANRIGAMVQVRFYGGWLIYLNYFVMREGGNTQQQIEQGPNFLNYGITIADCERVYQALSDDKVLMAGYQDNQAKYKDLITQASDILSHVAKT